MKQEYDTENNNGMLPGAGGLWGSTETVVMCMSKTNLLGSHTQVSRAYNAIFSCQYA